MALRENYRSTSPFDMNLKYLTYNIRQSKIISWSTSSLNPTNFTDKLSLKNTTIDLKQIYHDHQGLCQLCVHDCDIITPVSPRFFPEHVIISFTRKDRTSESLASILQCPQCQQQESSFIQTGSVIISVHYRDGKITCQAAPISPGPGLDEFWLRTVILKSPYEYEVHTATTIAKFQTELAKVSQPAHCAVQMITENCSVLLRVVQQQLCLVKIIPDGYEFRPPSDPRKTEHTIIQNTPFAFTFSHFRPNVGGLIQVWLRPAWTSSYSPTLSFSYEARGEQFIDCKSLDGFPNLSITLLALDAQLIFQPSAAFVHLFREAGGAVRLNISPSISDCGKLLFLSIREENTRPTLLQISDKPIQFSQNTIHQLDTELTCVLSRAANKSIDDICSLNYVKDQLVTGTLAHRDTIDLFTLDSTGQKILLDRCAPNEFSYISNASFIQKGLFRKTEYPSLWTQLSWLQFFFPEHDFTETEVVVAFELRMYIVQFRTLEHKYSFMCLCDRALQSVGKNHMRTTYDNSPLTLETLRSRYSQFQHIQLLSACDIQNLLATSLDAISFIGKAERVTATSSSARFVDGRLIAGHSAAIRNSEHQTVRVFLTSLGRLIRYGSTNSITMRILPQDCGLQLTAVAFDQFNQAHAITLEQSGVTSSIDPSTCALDREFQCFMKSVGRQSQATLTFRENNKIVRLGYQVSGITRHFFDYQKGDMLVWSQTNMLNSVLVIAPQGVVQLFLCAENDTEQVIERITQHNAWAKQLGLDASVSLKMQANPI